MTTTTHIHQREVGDNGYTFVDGIFSIDEIDSIITAVEQTDTSKPTFRKSADLFAIRQFIKEVPEVVHLIFTEKMLASIKELFGDEYFVVKSIYFDKPDQSNWFVAYHQDLTISVDKKIALDGYGPWTTKKDQFAVQPPLEILENNFTIRIHLDDTTEENGALRVIPGSHLKGIYRAENIDWTVEKEVTCNVPAGGIMIMKPLLLHASGKTTNGKKRRVIHIEFSNQVLHKQLEWAEHFDYETKNNTAND
ncbi:phytanoyl-CoA dioxygenase family protein [Flavipsychrobacter stenotrophus]|uniref:phytanoyl-CoA dioxygenase family protein n=1 Tax=Flavipsychrobacter stenotrophus TaxID=2077091 RepID=UPI001472F13D|nr:phytanoyl-CoA dioxygenase family protein [Flavipsychrobacter stenotrophus]